MRHPKTILLDLTVLHYKCRAGDCKTKCANRDDCHVDHKIRELDLAIDEYLGVYGPTGEGIL